MAFGGTRPRSSIAENRRVSPTTMVTACGVTCRLVGGCTIASVVVTVAVAVRVFPAASVAVTANTEVPDGIGDRRFTARSGAEAEWRMG